jgi:hypothetical protein
MPKFLHPLPPYLPLNVWTEEELTGRGHTRLEAYHKAILSGDVPRKNIPGTTISRSVRGSSRASYQLSKNCVSRARAMLRRTLMSRSINCEVYTK